MLLLIRTSQREFRLAREPREMVQSWIGFSEDDVKNFRLPR
jgi:hypothetical protein